MKSIEKLVEEISGFRDIKERINYLMNLELNKRSRLLISLPNEVSKELLSNLSIQSIVHHLDPDEATDILQSLEEEKRELILQSIEEDKRNKITFLLGFDEDTAAGYMDLNYLLVDPETTFQVVHRKIREFQNERKRFPVIFVNEDGDVKELPLSVILEKKSSKEEIKPYLKDIPQINFEMDKTEVLNNFLDNLEVKTTVLDEKNEVIGFIRSEDALKIAKDQQAENLIEFAGIKEEESVLDSAFTKVKYRYKWLIINLGTSFLAASIVGLFQQTISAFVLLAVYMPIVAGMGGNAGTQTLAVVVRGLVLDQIEFETAKKVITNEAIAGLINGAINGVLIALIATYWNQSPLLGAVLGVSMTINLAIAGFFGAITPIFLEKIGQDPATSATIFITTATDVLGFFVFLGLATLILT